MRRRSDCGSIPKSPAADPFWKRWRTTAGSRNPSLRPSVTGSTGWRRNRTGPDSNWDWADGVHRIIGKPARNAVISCARSRSATGLRPPSAAIGGSKINSTGSWTCNLAGMPAEPEGPLRRKPGPDASHGPQPAEPQWPAPVASVAANAAPPLMMITGCASSSLVATL